MLRIVAPRNTYSADGRTAVDVSFSMDDMAGSFTIEQGYDTANMTGFAFPDMGMGAEVSIYLDGKLAIRGQVDSREGRGDASSYRITLQGRTRTGNLVDSSATHKTGQWDKVKPSQVVRDIADPFGVEVSVQRDVQEIVKRFILRDGESAERAIRRISREFGMIPFSDEEGRLVIARPGARGVGEPLVLGRNILTWTATMDLKVLHSHVIAKGQAITDDHMYGRPATHIVAAVRDETVAAYRPLIIPMWGDATPDRVRRRAWIEALRRQGESLRVTVEVPGFTDAVTGDLYRPNVRHHVAIPPDGVDVTLVAKSVSFRMGPNEARTTIELVPEQAFSDGSEAGVPKSKGGRRLTKRGRRRSDGRTGGKAKGEAVGGSIGTGNNSCDARCWQDAFNRVRDIDFDEG